VVYGYSLEDGACGPLRSSFNQEPHGLKNLSTAANALLGSFSGFDSPEVVLEPAREPPTGTE